MTEKEPNDTTSGTSPDQSSDFLRAIGNFFRDHPAIAGSLLYLQVTTVGVVYSWSLFRQFRINIFDYAETNDFLLAAFKDPIVFGMSITTLVLGIGFGLYFAVRQPRLNVRVRGATRQGSASARIGITFGPTLMILSIVVGFIYTIGIPFFFASSKADTL